MGRSLTTLIVVAHPDDEILGAGIWMHRHSAAAIHIVHVTDGSPRDTRKARSLGFSRRESYALARRRELAAALTLVPVLPENCFRLGFGDQETFLHLPRLVNELESLIAKIKPERVLTHAYEGGHPDHDSVAFAVSRVRQRLRSFRQWEFPLYHSGPRGAMITGSFISVKGRETIVSFSREERKLKAKMLSCFPTQNDILSRFRLKRETFRLAPRYDFSVPPHSGPLLYERWGWRIAGAQWRLGVKRASV